jgi:hypothetical protein
MVPAGSCAPSLLCRAACTADNVASDAPVVSRPPEPSGKPNSSHSQRITLCSSATSAGAVEATPVYRFTVCARNSASTEL